MPQEYDAIFNKVGSNTNTNLKYIDVHAHLHGRINEGQQDYNSVAVLALEQMDDIGIQRMIIMPPPFAPDEGGIYECNEYSGILSQYPDRFTCLGGGGTLMPMIIEAVDTGTVTDELRNEFEQKAEEIIKNYGAVGFGELAALHLSFGSSHPFEEVPPNHELFKLLVDIASKYNAPLDIHMEAVVEDMETPERLLQFPKNPPTLTGNIQPFEELLEYALTKSVNIIWAHVG